jgi:hypothetical protein
MPNPILKELYDNVPLKEAWAAFIIDQLNQEAIRRVYAREDAAAIPEAREIIEKSFKRLNELFQPKTPKRATNRAV